MKKLFFLLLMTVILAGFLSAEDFNAESVHGPGVITDTVQFEKLPQETQVFSVSLSEMSKVIPLQLDVSYESWQLLFDNYETDRIGIKNGFISKEAFSLRGA